MDTAAAVISTWQAQHNGHPLCPVQTLRNSRQLAAPPIHCHQVLTADLFLITFYNKTKHFRYVLIIRPSIMLTFRFSWAHINLTRITLTTVEFNLN